MVRERGQSLVETVLTFSFLMLLVIGIAEGSVALQRQLVVVNAAREGARFGSFGARPDAVYIETLLAASEMIEFRKENAVIAVIYAETNPAGNAFSKWIVDVYPDSEGAPYVTRKKTLADLRAGVRCAAENQRPCPLAANLRMVIVAVRYEHESLFGFPIIGALADRIPIGSWTMMPMMPRSERRE